MCFETLYYLPPKDMGNESNMVTIVDCIVIIL